MSAIHATYLLFIFQKLKTELKKLLHSSHTFALSKGTIFDQKY